VTYERQNMMRGHGYSMQELADMLSGRRLFNRAEAARLARELEEGMGDDLIRNFAPGTVVAGSRTAPSTWRHFGAFTSYAKAAEQSSARLADALEKAPAESAPPMARPMPPRGMAYGPRRHPGGTQIPVEALQEFGRLNATCRSCHALFRGWRR
jgi:cytochrome c556